MNFLYMRVIKVVLCYFYKVSGPIHLSNWYILKIKERQNYQNDKFIKYKTDESSGPLI
jgi:hypothetical protein